MSGYLWGCGGTLNVGLLLAVLSARADEPIDPVVATVNGETIALSQYVERATDMERGERTNAELLQKVIEEQLLVEEAVRMGLLDDPKVRRAVVDALLRRDVYGTVRNADFSDAELRAYFAEHAEDFVVPEKRQIKRIAIDYEMGTRTRGEAKDLAVELYKRISTSPETFNGEAEDLSDDASRRRGGDLGFIARSGKPGIPQDIVDAAWKLDVGEVSKPFDDGSAYNVIVVAAEREARVRTYEQVRGPVLREVKNDRYEALYMAYVAKLLAGATVSSDPAAVGAVVLPDRVFPALDPADLVPYVGDCDP